MTYNCCRPDLELAVVETEMVAGVVNVADTWLSVFTLMFFAGPFLLEL